MVNITVKQSEHLNVTSFHTILNVHHAPIIELHYVLYYHRWSKRNVNQPELASSSSDSGAHKFTNNKYLSTPEKVAKIDSLQKKAKLCKQRENRLREKIRALTLTQSDTVCEDFSNDLKQLMSENTDKVKTVYPEGSFARLFWEEQLKVAMTSNPKQIRWHPVIIKWCLNLKLMSSSTYHALRTSGFITLPSDRTLRDYTHYFQSKPGFQDDVNIMLQDEVQKASIPQRRRYFGLLIDEMKIKENLVYNKVSGEIVGFVNIGDINQQLLNLEQDKGHPPVAKYVFVLMVRGLLFHLKCPYAHFATENTSGELMFPIIWEAIRQLESCGMKVLFVTADGAGPMA